MTLPVRLRLSVGQPFRQGTLTPVITPTAERVRDADAGQLGLTDGELATEDSEGNGRSQRLRFTSARVDRKSSRR